MKIYRYFKWKWGLDSLTERRLKTSNPSKFNDPFEIKPNFNSADFDRDWVREVAKKEHIIEEGWRLDGPGVFRNYQEYRKYHLENLDNIVEQKIGEMRENLKILKADFPYRAAAIWRILCFSRSKSSLLMWSHYSDSHSGIVMEFDIGNEYFRALGEGHNVIYSDKKMEYRPRISPSESLKENQRSMCWKSLDWAYEQEIRYFVPVESVIDDFYYFPAENCPITGVILGSNSEEKSKFELARVLSDDYYKQTKMYQASTDDFEFKLNIKKIDV